ncbi:MAG: phage tail protein [Rhodothermia bacterium]|nr:phage tail protein [Rhodothermia bacterium]
MEQYLGEIRLFSGSYVPHGWMSCDGQLLPIQQYTALFSILGTRFGGDGRTTFGLPDLRGRIPVAPDQQRSQGFKGGSESYVLKAENLPVHGHKVNVKLNVSTASGTQDSPVGGYPAGTGTFDKEYNTTADSSMAKEMVEITAQPAGASNPQPISLMQPTVTMMFIISVDGYYPEHWDN